MVQSKKRVKSPRSLTPTYYVDTSRHVAVCSLKLGWVSTSNFFWAYFHPPPPFFFWWIPRKVAFGPLPPPPPKLFLKRKSKFCGRSAWKKNTPHLGPPVGFSKMAIFGGGGEWGGGRLIVRLQPQADSDFKLFFFFSTIATDGM